MKRFLKSESNLERVWQVNDDNGDVSHFEIEVLNPEADEDGTTFYVANVPPEPKKKRRVFRRKSK